MTTRLIIIRNADDRDFDKYVIAPEGTSTFEAKGRVDEVIHHCRNLGLGWDEMELQLEMAGFEVPAWAHADEEV